jgi:hypothetical protein
MTRRSVKVFLENVAGVVRRRFFGGRRFAAEQGLRRDVVRGVDVGRRYDDVTRRVDDVIRRLLNVADITERSAAVTRRAGEADWRVAQRAFNVTRRDGDAPGMDRRFQRGRRRRMNQDLMF